MMAADSGFADPDEEDALLRPAWEDTPDETDADRGRPRRPASAARTPGQPTGPDDLHALLIPLCAATDALARLDARAGAAADALREGLIARLVYAEAARLPRPYPRLGPSARPRPARRGTHRQHGTGRDRRRPPQPAADV